MTLYVERWERACEIAPDDSEIVRHARPLTDADRPGLIEARIARLLVEHSRRS